ncbi:MAG: class I SAM-dependent rRNA methyltransferase [Deltaproteobacteria bacterium]|nr:class I SAM-dependent rRNA methyltransferase [Deltaproteobacteria bacterium]
MYPIITITAKGLGWFQRGHPWIFSTDITFRGTEEAGLVTVKGPKNEFLAQALFSPASKIALRILSRKEETIDHAWWEGKIKLAIERRRAMNISSTAKRLVFAEADGLPSLIIDAYGPYLVVQTLSAGMEKFKADVFDVLKKLIPAEGILERNDAPIRQKEKLAAIKQCVAGEVPKQTVIEEAGLKFVVDLWEGQKTGAFLDQRDNRIFAEHKSGGKALDVFSYEGWFACHMAKKAESVLCVESSQKACDRILENAKRNGLENKIAVEETDAFDFLKKTDQSGQHFDTVNLDPPAFVKTASEIEQGFRGYKEINLRAMKLLKPKGILITSSCSYHFSGEDFEEMLSAAAEDAKTNLEVLSQTGAAIDHPTLSAFPEGNYLKCYFLKVTT